MFIPVEHVIGLAVIEDLRIDETGRMATAERGPPLKPELGLLMPAQVILPDQAGVIAGVRQRLRQIAEFLNRRIVLHRVTGWQSVVHAIGRRNQPGHQHGTRRRAHTGGSVGVSEQQTVARQLINIGSPDVPIAVRPKQVGALVVGHDEKHVGAVVGCGGCREKGCQDDCSIECAAGLCSPQHIRELYPIVTFGTVGGGLDKHCDVITTLDQHLGDRRSRMAGPADDQHTLRRCRRS